MKAFATVCSTTNLRTEKAKNTPVKFNTKFMMRLVCSGNTNRKDMAIKMKEIKLTKENFENEVIHSDKPVLIDFWAEWCGPCRMIAPIVEEIANEKDDIKVCKVNVDEEQELASAFQVTSIPLLAVVKDGKVTNTAVGYMTKENILKLL